MIGQATPGMGPPQRRLRRLSVLTASSVKDQGGNAIAGGIQNLDTRDRLHGLVVGKSPHGPLVASDLNQVGSLAELAVSKPVTHYRIAVGQPVQARHELQADARQLVASNLPE